jgi:glycosyltransferase involved in cell wall biosynthesis
MTTSKPLVSVVIPAYNYAATLPRAVDSVMPQLNERAELLVIDDGSTDATPDVLRTLHERYPGGFRSIRQDNAGLAAVRNRGIDEARGDYLVFLDADDEMVEGALAELTAHLDQHPDTRLVIAGHYSVREDGRVALHRPHALPAGELARVKAYLLDKTLAVSNGACAMHREVFTHGRYPESFRNAEDIPVFAQVFARYPCSCLASPMARIYKHGDSLRHNLTYDLQIGERLVDEVFASGRLPESVQCLRRAFTAQRYLSLFRNFLLAGQRDQARHFYRQALRADWRAALRWSYTRKAVKLWLS